MGATVACCATTTACGCMAGAESEEDNGTRSIEEEEEAELVNPKAEDGPLELLVDVCCSALDGS